MEAVRNAKHAVNIEFYEFKEGAVADEFLAALTERAKAGVEVRIIVDALGSFATRTSYFDKLKAAGGQMRWYHPIRWNTWQRANNRTHRKLLIVDGRIGFIGGAGVADFWMRPTGDNATWRDTMFRVEGDGVAGLITAFCENWLEAAGEILSGENQFAFEARDGGSKSFIVASTPHGGGTQARILFQALIETHGKAYASRLHIFFPTGVHDAP